MRTIKNKSKNIFDIYRFEVVETSDGEFYPRYVRKSDGGLFSCGNHVKTLDQAKEQLYKEIELKRKQIEYVEKVVYVVRDS